MSWLGSLFTPEGRAIRRARSLADQYHFSAALDELDTLEGDEAHATRERIVRQAARFWLTKAREALADDDAPAMQSALRGAAKYFHEDLRTDFRNTRRAIRIRNVQLTSAEHWVELLNAAERQGRRHFSEQSPSRGVPAYSIFAHRSLHEALGKLWGADPLTPDTVWAATPAQVDQAVPLIRQVFPDELAELVEPLGPAYVRASAFIALGRPDLAVLPLLELPDNDALVCLDRARCAYMLGYPRIAITGLQGFATAMGGHRSIRRLNTGVFLAQMALASGDPKMALSTLKQLPVRFLGRRPCLLYGQLLVEQGEADLAVAHLESWLDTHPEDAEAQALLAVATQLVSDPDSGVQDGTTAAEMSRIGPMLDDT